MTANIGGRHASRGAWSRHCKSLVNQPSSTSVEVVERPANKVSSPGDPSRAHQLDLDKSRGKLAQDSSGDGAVRSESV